MNADLKQMVTPKVSSVNAEPDSITGLSWKTQRIGVDLLNDDLKNQLNGIQRQLQSTTSSLDRIQKITNTVLQPIISILRSVEDPFAAVIQQLVNEAEKILQAFDSQGIFVLDMVSDKIGNNATANTFYAKLQSNVSSFKDYQRSLNQAILRSRANSLDPDLVAQAGLKIDDDPNSSSFGELIDDPGSNRNQNVRMTPTEAQKVGQTALSMANALTWVKQYNSDAIDLAQRISDTFSRMETTVLAIKATLDANGGPSLYLHFNGKPAVLDSEKDTPLSKLNQTFFKLPAVSALVTAQQQKTFFDNLFSTTGYDNDVILWTTQTTGVNWNSTTISVPQDQAGVDTFLKNKNKIIDTLTSLTSQIDDIEKQFQDSGGSIDAKKQKIYVVIESLLRTTDGTNVSHQMQTGGQNVQPINGQAKTTYTNVVKSILLNSSGQNTPEVIELVRANLVNKNKQLNSAADINSISEKDVIDTYAGFGNSKIITGRLQTALNDNSNLEVSGIQRAVDFMNTQLEFQGLIDNKFSAPKAPKGNPAQQQALRPPRMTSEVAATSSSESTKVTVTTEDQSKITAILEGVTQDLSKVDASTQFTAALKTKYNGYTLAMGIKLRNAFIDLDTALSTLANDCRGKTQIDSIIEADFHRIIADIMDIKIAFYPFLINNSTVTKMLDQVKDDIGQKQLQLEKLFIDPITGTDSSTPYSEINAYLKQFVSLFQKANTDPFALFERGFEFNPILSDFKLPSNLDKRTEFLLYFANIVNTFVTNGAQLPVFFIDNVGGGGLQQQLVGIIGILSQITNSNLANLLATRRKVLSDLAAANETASCQTNSSGVQIPDRVKKGNTDKINEAKAELDDATNRMKALNVNFTSKLQQIPDANKNNANGNTSEKSKQLVKEINTFVDQLGGFKYQFNSSNGLISPTSEIVTGTLNSKIIQLNIRLNKLKADNLSRDRTVADQLGDTSLRTQVFRSIAIAQEQLNVETNTARKKELNAQLDYLNNIKNSIGSLDAQTSQVFINNLTTIEEVDKGIEGMQKALDDISSVGTTIDLGFTFTQKELNLLLGDSVTNTYALVQPSNPNNFNISDLDLTDQDIITLFTLAASTDSFDANEIATLQAKLAAYVVASLALRSTSDYSKYIGFSSIRNDSGLFPRIPLGFRARLTELQRIKAALKINVNDAKTKASKEQDDSFLPNGNWITPTTKDNWVTEFITTLRDPGDIRRPIFIDDISKAKALNAVVGALGGKSLGDKAQDTLDKATSLGEMTAVFYVAASTDAYTVMKNIENIYRFLVKPEKFQAQINQFAQRLAANFEDIEGILTDSGIRGIEDFFSHATEDGFDRLLNSVSLFRNQDAHCLNNFKPVNRPIRNDKWISIKVTDFYLIAHAFNAIQKFLDYIQNSFTVKLGLADLLQDLLDFINSRINLLKKIAAGIGVMIELIDFIGSLNFEVATLRVDNVTSINQLEKSLRSATNFPQPFFAPNPDDPMYILAIVVVMPTSFYDATFSKWFHEKPVLPSFDPSFGFTGGVDNLGAGPTDITNTGITGATGGSGSGNESTPGTGGILVS